MRTASAAPLTSPAVQHCVCISGFCGELVQPHFTVRSAKQVRDGICKFTHQASHFCWCSSVHPKAAAAPSTAACCSRASRGVGRANDCSSPSWRSAQPVASVGPMWYHMAPATAFAAWLPVRVSIARRQRASIQRSAVLRAQHAAVGAGVDHCVRCVYIQPKPVGTHEQRAWALRAAQYRLPLLRHSRLPGRSPPPPPLL